MTLSGLKFVAGFWAAALFTAASCGAADSPAEKFFEQHCADCHLAGEKEGGLDLAALSRDMSDAETLRRWVRVYDRVAGGEMPPQSAVQPDAAAKQAFLVGSARGWLPPTAPSAKWCIAG